MNPSTILVAGTIILDMRNDILYCNYYIVQTSHRKAWVMYMKVKCASNPFLCEEKQILVALLTNI